MKKKSISLIALCLCCLMVFTACSAKPAQSTTTEPAAETASSETAARPFEGQTLTCLFMSGVYADAARDVAPAVEAATGAKIEIVDFPFATLHEKMLLDFTSGTASYDVIDIADQWDGEMAAFLEPLDDYIARDNYDVEDFDQNIFDNAGRWQGVTYGIPNANTPLTMAYRTDLISEDELPKTWDEYVALAEKFYDPDNGMYGVAPAASASQYGTVFYTRLWSLGGEWADEDWNPTMDSDEARAALEISKRVIDVSDPACLSWGLAESAAAFVSGHAAFLEGWPTLNFLAMANDPDQNKIGDNWALAPFPAEKTGINNLSAWDIAINANSEKKDLAWEFIKAYTSAEAQYDAFEKYSILSPRLSFWERDDVKNSPLYPLKAALSDSLQYWRIPASNEAKTEVCTGVDSYLSGEKTIDEAMAYIQEGIGRALQNNPPAEGLKNVTAQTVNARKK